MTHDIVLNVEDIKRVGQQLGKNVTLLQIDQAQHDIFLSPEPVRNNGFEKNVCLVEEDSVMRSLSGGGFQASSFRFLPSCTQRTIC